MVFEVELKVEMKVKTNISEHVVDPGLRKYFNTSTPNEKDRTCRLYLLRDPFQPVNNKFPLTSFEKKKLRLLRVLIQKLC